MKFVFTFLFITISISFIKGQSSKDLSVQTWAETNLNESSINIRWLKFTSNVTSYDIYRKAKNATSWGSILKSSNANDTSWTDTTISIGTIYEYRIQKMNGSTELGVSYILSGIEIPVTHHRGNLLVIAERTLADSIPNEMSDYLKDLAADGWRVNMIEVLLSDSIQKIKREIKNYNDTSGGLKTIIFIGHVPVPYSGNYAPDGHSEHAGCWPTDAYYSINYDQWLDEESNSFGIARSENVNLPGDGKWDNNILPAKVLYQSGRIDLSNMPTFSKDEAQLTAQYFKKNHDYRYKITTTVEKGIIEDNFTTIQGAYSSAAWRGFSVLFGPKNIEEGDFLTKCQSQNIMFGFGAGGGAYTSCDGIASTDSFKTRKGAIFNMFFGSYFGDWDNSNNFLRAPLAAAENGLTVAWSGRPYWQNHPLALGEPIGYCVALTQNNQGTYRDNSFGKTVHIGLMGDPSLRLNMISPPDSLKTELITNQNKVKLSWKASNDSEVIGYFVYRSQDILNNTTPINSAPATELTFIDSTPAIGINHYLVKAVKLTVTASGSYYNLSQGIFAFQSISSENTRPNVITQNSTIYLNEFGTANINAASVNNGSTATYQIDSYVLSKSNFTCSDIGANTITLTVTDIQSNSDTGNATITVQDNLQPTIITKAFTLNLVNGSGTLIPSDIDNGSSDNCGIASKSVYPSNFNCSHSGNQTVTLTIIDVNGNIANKQATVTIQSKPEINISVTRYDTTYTGGDASTIYLGYGAQKVNLNTNVSGGESYNYSWSPSTNLSCSTCASPIFKPTNAGTYNYTVTVTNNFGCVSTESISLCVIDVRASDCKNEKVYICHKSANSSRRKTTEISKNADAAHLKNHSDDKLGKCGQSCNFNKMDLTQQEEIKELNFLTCNPNPYSNTFTFNYDRNESEAAKLTIFNANGELIQTYDLSYSFKDDQYGQDLPSGIYFVKFENGIISKTIRLVKIK